MPAVPQIFDNRLHAQRLVRAVRSGPAPFLLDHVASDLAERLGPVLRQFKDVLDFFSPLGAGGDVLARRHPEARITRLGVDPALVRQAGDVAADPETCNLGEGGYDAAVSLLALQTVNDVPGALARLRRALRPDGLFIAAMAGGDTLKELRQAFLGAEIETTGGAAPRVAPFADVRGLGQLLQRAGFALPVADSEILTVRYASALALMRDLRAMGATSVLAERSRRPLTRALIARVCAVYQERFADSDGRVRATFEIIWLSGWAPHESQQKPLRPGSARQSLAGALAEVAARRPLADPSGEKP